MLSQKNSNDTVISEISFSSFQLLSHVRLFATPLTAARQASLSITNSWSLPIWKYPQSHPNQWEKKEWFLKGQDKHATLTVLWPTRQRKDDCVLLNVKLQSGIIIILQGLFAMERVVLNPHVCQRQYLPQSNPNSWLQ